MHRVSSLARLWKGEISRMGRSSASLALRFLTKTHCRSPLTDFSTSSATSPIFRLSSPRSPVSNSQAGYLLLDDTKFRHSTTFPASEVSTRHSAESILHGLHGVFKLVDVPRTGETVVQKIGPVFSSQMLSRLSSAPMSMAFTGQIVRGPRPLLNSSQPWHFGALGSHWGFASTAREFSSSGSQEGSSSVPPSASTSGAEGSAPGEPSVLVNATESTQKAINSLVEMLVGAWEASKEATAEMFPEVHNWMDPSGGGVAELVVPAGTAIGVSLAAWLVLPRVLRKFHSYVESGPTARLLGRMPQEKVPYKLSVFGALDIPARMLATAVTFSYLGYMVAPTSIGAQYLTQLWSGATVLSVIWFLYRWKCNVFARLFSGRTVTGPDRDRYLTMDRLSSMALLVLGCLLLAEACGLAVQSILTVGGIGGVATAFAARDILGNVLSGVALQFSRPFSVGDAISAGSVNGQVVKMGVHSTQLLNSDKYPIVVPNSYFSNQVIVNKSRVCWRGLTLNLPIRIKDFEKIPPITNDIRTMLTSYPKVYLEHEKPRCHVSQIAPTSFNIVITCNLKPMSTDDYFMAEEELMMESARIVTKAGAALGADVSS